MRAGIHPRYRPVVFRDASPTRPRNREAVDGRLRADPRKFGLSRIRMQEMAHPGGFPGITRFSW